MREWKPTDGSRSRRGNVRLGVDDEQLDVKKTGFRPSANVRAPSRPYSIQQHEVTWEELEGWLGNRTLPILSSPPAWLPSERSARARLPATGVPWRIAHDYCVAMGASLPTEEQWEHAARGAERRPYAWGDAQPDPDRSNVGPGEHPVAVMTRDQDRTPGRREDAVWDLMGNAREWTLDLWRNANGRPENIAEGLTFRTVRGLPLVTSSGNFRPPERAPAAHRTRLCASGLCPAGTDAVLVDVGFRCVRE